MEKYIEKTLNDVLSLEVSSIRSDGFFDGLSGYAYALAKLEEPYQYAEKVNEIMKFVLERIFNAESYCLYKENLYDGLVGVAFVLQELENMGVLEDDNKVSFEDLHEKFNEDALRYLEDNCFDYLYGSIGILMYLHVAGEQNYVEQILTKILEKQEQNTLTPFFHQSSILNGTYFGYSHGLASIIKVLSLLDSKKADVLITSSLDFLKETMDSNEQLFYNKRYYFPRANNLKEGKIVNDWEPSCTWSNSDLNIACMLYSLPEKFQTAEWKERANQIILSSTKRKSPEEALHDRKEYRLFFGSSGVAKMYRYLLNKNILIQEITPAYEYWIEKTVDYLHTDNDRYACSYFHGKMGALLCLNEYLNKNNGDWGRYMLLF